MKARQAQAYETMRGQFEGLLGRLQVSSRCGLVAVVPPSLTGGWSVPAEGRGEPVRFRALRGGGLKTLPLVAIRCC